MNRRSRDAVTALPRGPVSPLAPSACAGVMSGLLVRCGRGEERALGSLFDLLYGVVSATLRRRLPVGADTDDLVVEVFREVWRVAPAFDAGRQDPLLWVLDIATAAAPSGPTRPALAAS